MKHFLALATAFVVGTTLLSLTFTRDTAAVSIHVPIPDGQTTGGTSGGGGPGVSPTSDPEMPSGPNGSGGGQPVVGGGVPVPVPPDCPIAPCRTMGLG